MLTALFLFLQGHGVNNWSYSAVAESIFSTTDPLYVAEEETSGTHFSSLSLIYTSSHVNTTFFLFRQGHGLNNLNYCAVAESVVSNDLYAPTILHRPSNYDSMAGQALYADLQSETLLHNESTYAYSDIQGTASGLLQDPNDVTARVGTSYMDVGATE